jgi:glycosyltransferase involved in cell wall biosynthesis
VVCDAEAVRMDLIDAWGLEPAKVRAVPLAPADIDPDSRTTDNADSPTTARADPRAAGGSHLRAAAAADPHAAAGADPRDAAGSHPRAAAGSQLRAAGPDPRAGARPFFLFVGALEPRKAPDLLVEAFSRARQRGLDAELVFAGDGRLAPRLAAPGVKVLGRVDGSRLRELYAGAIALVLPSWLEGFGLTPVEALAHGAPAIVSDLPVLREVLGDDGALYVAPGDVEALATALLDLAGDVELRARLVTAGQAATAHLSWAETARRMWAILAEAAA